MRRPRVTSFGPALAVLTGGTVLAHALIAGLMFTGVARGDPVGDWTAFYTAARMVWEGKGEALYDPEAQAAAQRALFGPGEPFAFTQPAFVALVLSPLGALSYAASFWVWLTLNMAAGAALLALAWWSTSHWHSRDRSLALGLAALSPPAMAVFLNGQLDLFALAGLAGCYAMHRRAMAGRAGIALALALVKPQLAVGAVLLLLATRQWKTLALFVAAGAMLLATPVVMLGFHTALDQARLLTSFASASEGYRVNAAMMANVRGAVVSLTGSGDVALWGPPFAVVAFTSTVVAVGRWRALGAAHEASWSLAFLLPLLVSPHVHIQSLVLLIPAALFFVDARRRAGAPPRYRSFVAGYVALTVLAAVTIAGFAALFIAPMAAFTLMATRWPDGSIQRQAEPMALAA